MTGAWRNLGCAVTSAVIGLTAMAAELPIFKMGLVTDTHWKEDPRSFARTEAALQVFKREKVDIVANIGDIADKHYPKAYRYYRELFRKVFPENPPRELFVYANHDLLRRNDIPGSGIKMDIDQGFAELRKHLEIPHPPYHSLAFKGYPILLIPQFFDPEKFERMISAAEKEFPDKPIIVLDHVPAPRGDAAKNNKRRLIYDRHPRVVHIYGHVHVPLRDETSIWQDAYTSVNAGCLQQWCGALVGTAPGVKQCCEFAVMEAYPDKLVFRRFSTEDGQEIKTPWIVPLPFDPATAPYRPDRRAAAEKAPEFAEGAALTLSPDRPFSALTLRWPGAKRGDEAYKYFIRIGRREADGGFRDFARQDCFGEFYLAPSRRKGRLAAKLSAGLFEPGRSYRIAVFPVGFFGHSGVPLTAEFNPPAEFRRAETVFESRDPMKELVFASGLTGATPMPLENGFYRHRGGAARLIIPKKYWAGPRGTRFRFTVDLESRQSEGALWAVVLRNATPLYNANHRMSLAGGVVPDARYVIEFRQRKAEYFYDLLIREGAPGQIRFKYVKLERLP